MRLTMYYIVTDGCVCIQICKQNSGFEVDHTFLLAFFVSWNILSDGQDVRLE